jgi:hypothetical protein
LAILDHVGERFTRLDLTLESQEHRSRCVINAAIGDHHVENRLSFVGHPTPNAKCIKHAARRCRDRGSASILTRLAKFRIGQCDNKILSERLAQRDGERKPGKSAACDQDVRTMIWEYWQIR